MNKIIQGDTLYVLKRMPSEYVDCIVTSPPYYGLRDYGVDGQIGLEPTLDEYLEKMLAITAELKRVLKSTGTMWWNHGDSFSRGNTSAWFSTYADCIDPANSTRVKGGGSAVPEKSLTLQAHRLAIRMVDEQRWTLRNIIIWHKPNGLPSPVQDRFPVDYEPVFFFAKSRRYWFERQFEPYTSEERLCGLTRARAFGYDGKSSYEDWYNTRRPKIRWHDRDGLKEGFGRDNAPPLIHPRGRAKRAVWKIGTRPYAGAHFATFPPALIETPIKAGCPEGGIVLDPFMGSGTVALVAKNLGRQYLGIELKREYIKLANERISEECAN